MQGLSIYACPSGPGGQIEAGAREDSRRVPVNRDLVGVGRGRFIQEVFGRGSIFSQLFFCPGETDFVVGTA